ncbi:GGDEF domain-containing protein [Shewanella sp. S1-58-MNA-CIBAN-0166]|uniref:GGDEF domain-containing protein n=1 Tax=Shewanella sp. S1-58-MNA-CIBAN-0166 TaxID=3140467 RepID=UPI00331742FA
MLKRGENDSFQQMSEEVINSREELSQRVRDRTADLVIAKTKALHLANHDVVIGLANRLSNRQATERLRDKKQPFSILFIDLDGFKVINDTYGHGIGDALLVKIGQQVSKHLFPSEILARYGGDEFVLLLPNDIDSDAVMATANSVLKLIKQPFQIGSHSLIISACIGAAIYNGVDSDTDSLIHRADVAMYQAKHAGKSQVILAD